MAEAFHLLDLPSQALAVQRVLAGRPEAEKLAWLSARGRLVPLGDFIATLRANYLFESVLGLRCVFFFDEDEFVFFADHAWYTIKC